MSHIERSKHPTCVVLGWLQMAGAATAAMLLVTSGVTKVAIIVTAITAVVLAASLIVFRRR